MIVHPKMFAVSTRVPSSRRQSRSDTSGNSDHSQRIDGCFDAARFDLEVVQHVPANIKNCVMPKRLELPNWALDSGADGEARLSRG